MYRHLTTFGPPARRFDLDSLDPERPHGAGPYVLIWFPGFTSHLQIGWVKSERDATSTVVVSKHAYFGNTAQFNHPVTVPSSSLTPIGDSISCLQDLRHAATVQGVFHDHLPVHPTACSLRIRERKFKWIHPTVWVDASKFVKTPSGLHIQALFMTIEPEGEPKLHPFTLAPERILCVSPFWEPAIAEGTPFRDRNILHAALLFTSAPPYLAEEYLDHFKEYWARMKRLGKVKRTTPACDHPFMTAAVLKEAGHAYKAVMQMARRALAQCMITETKGPKSQPFPPECQVTMPCDGPLVPQEAPKMQFGWFTRRWIDGDDTYCVNEKREFHDLTEMLLELTLPYGVCMKRAHHIVSTVMLTDGRLAEFTKQMREVYIDAQKQIEGKRENLSKATAKFLWLATKKMKKHGR
jgi:hypothetical protein